MPRAWHQRVADHVVAVLRGLGSGADVVSVWSTELTWLGRNATGAGVSARERIVRHQAYRRLLTMNMTNAMMANTTKMTIKIPTNEIYSHRRRITRSAR